MKNRHYRPALLLLLCLLLVSATLSGASARDRISVQLRDGSSLEGEIVREDADSYLIRTLYGEFTVRKDQIREKSIDRARVPSGPRPFRWEVAAVFRFAPVASAHELDAGSGAALRLGLAWPAFSVALSGSLDRFTSGFDTASRLDCRALALEVEYRIGLSPQFSTFFRVSGGVCSARAVEPAVFVDQTAPRALLGFSTGPRLALGALRFTLGFGCLLVFEPGEALVSLPLEFSVGAAF